MSSGSIRVGVGGWTYEPWRGTFYPEGLPHKRELEYATAHLTAIEINATYYRLQKPDSFRKWAAVAPDDFRFTVKASRYITQRKLLAEAGESITRFLSQGLEELGDRLGPILWQLRDGKRFDREDFARFLDLIPDRHHDTPLRHALEVRDESFRDQAFLDLARDRNMAVVFADNDAFPCIEERTADFTYARLQRSAAECETGYDAKALDHWERQASQWANGGRDVYVFFISGAKVRNPAAAQALIQKLKA